MCNWATLLYTWNYHNIVNRLYSNIKWKGKTKKNLDEIWKMQRQFMSVFITLKTKLTGYEICL